jgi:hypothetical protein
MSAGPKLEKSIADLQALNEVLSQESAWANRNMGAAYRQFNAKPRNLKRVRELNFWIKAVIRSFFAHLDGMGFALRGAVIASAAESGLSLTPREVADLSAKKYDPRTNTVSSKWKRLSPKQSFEHGFEYFPRLYGSSLTLDTAGGGYRAFNYLVEIRNDLTHPKRLEDFYVSTKIVAVRSATVWFYRQMSTLLRDHAASAGVQFGAMAPVGDSEDFDEATIPRRKIFSPEEEEEIRRDPVRPLKYARSMLRHASGDTSRALSLVKRPGLKKFSVDQQAAFRSAVRTLFSEVESTSSTAASYLQSGVVRGEIHLSDLDTSWLTARSKPPEEKYATVLTIWSREVGNHIVLPTDGPLWDAFHECRLMRNHFTHPTDPKKLEITDGHLQTVIDGLTYVMESLDALTIDEERWVSLLPDRDEPDLEADDGEDDEDNGGQTT